MEKKKLKDFLDGLDGDKKIAIGTKEGSCFLIFCTAKETDKIETVFKDYRNAMKKSIPSKRLKLRNLLENPIRLSSKDSVERQTSIMKARVRKIDHAMSSLDYAKSFASKSYQPIMKREVLEFYPRYCDDYYVIIVSGKENGKFWNESDQSEHIKGIT